MIVTQDERTSTRFEARYPIQIEANGRPITGQSLNLGIGGACVEPGDTLPDSTPVICRVDAEGRPVEAQGEVAWQYTEDGVYRMGIRFCALSPAMAGWLSSVSSTHAAIAPTHEPISDTQPMKVPAAPEEMEMATTLPDEAPTATAAPAPTPTAAQLDLWKKSTAVAEPAVASDPESVDKDVLFDDMPSPEARMMRTVEAMSAKHRLAAFAISMRGKLAGLGRAVAKPIQKARARRASTQRTATTMRLPVGRPHSGRAARVKELAAHLRLGLLVTVFASIRARVGRPAVLLHNRKVQLGLAATGVLLLVGSGLAFMFSGPTEPEATDAQLAPDAPAPNNSGSYWDPPVMPVPDQEIAEAPAVPAPAPAPAAPEPVQVAAPVQPPEPAAVPIPDMPLPEPAAMEAEPSEPSAIPEPLAGAGEEAAPAAAEEAPRRPSARERRAQRRAEHEAAQAEEHARTGRRQARREEPAPRADHRAATAQSAPAPTHARDRREGASAPASHATAQAAPAARSTFRLNLSGAPAAIHTYPLANPNGIVIDVANLQHPGEATKLTSDDPRIRFVKIINRDQGVRFIVYLNGPLPQYEVEPSGRGVRVALRD